MIYFIMSGLSGPIKIGYTSSCPEQRLKELRGGTGYFLHLLAWMEGDKNIERDLHKRFAHYRSTGGREWFLPADELLAFIEKNAQWDRLPPTGIAVMAKDSSHDMMQEALNAMLDAQEQCECLEDENKNLRCTNHELRKQMLLHSHELDDLMRKRHSDVRSRWGMF